MLTYHSVGALKTFALLVPMLCVLSEQKADTGIPSCQTSQDMSMAEARHDAAIGTWC